MEAILENIQSYGPAVGILWLVFLLHTLWRPQKLFNCFLLMLALGASLFFLACLFGPYTGTAMMVLFLLILLALLLVPLLLICNGIYTMRAEGKALAHMLSLILGILIFIGELSFAVIFLLSDFSVHPAVYNLGFFVGSTVLYFSLLILGFVLYMVFMHVIPRRRSFDFIIIHGCGLIGGERVSRLLSNRLDKAIALYRRSRTPAILMPSGGQGGDEKLSEAEAMARYLQEHGIPAERIVCEDRSLDTMENLANCKALIVTRKSKPRIALVTSNYHLYRCLLYARKLKMKVTGAGAAVAAYYWPSATLREFVAVLKEPKPLVCTILGYLAFVLLPCLWLMLN